MAATQQYDAIVIGSGQGGSPLALALAGAGMNTAIVESRNVGGTCINYGCTPTKTMVASARAAHVVGRAGDFGIDVSPRPADMVRVRERKLDIVASFRGGSERRISEAQDLTLIRGIASFVDRRTVSIDTSHVKTQRTEPQEKLLLTAPKIFINTGTRPRLPSIPGLGSVDYLDNESIMELDTAPRHLLVIGGGYIGAEFAQMFRRFGSEVTIVQKGPRLLPREEPELSDAVGEVFRSAGIRIHTGARVERVEKTNGGIRSDILIEKNGTRADRASIECSHILVAAGRAPNSEALALDRAGIDVDSAGFIRVNDRLETGVEGVWALGDVKGGPQFTHISYDDFRVIRRNVLDAGGGGIGGRIVAYTVFIDPQLGHVGMTERDARAAGFEVRIAEMPMTSSARALEIDETAGSMKAVVDARDGKILGFSMFGIDAGEIAGAVQIAMLGGLRYTDLRDAPFSHPTTMEALNNLFSGLP